MLVKAGEEYYEALSLAVVRVLCGSLPLRPGFTEAAGSSDYPGLEWLEFDRDRCPIPVDNQSVIPVDKDVAALVPYRGGAKTFTYVSASEVLEGQAKPSDLEGRIVLVGTSAPGLLDMRSTPVGGVFPGVEIHANLISGILDGTIKQMPPYVLGAEFLLLALAGLVMALVLPLLNPMRSSAVTVAVLVAVVGTNLAVWQYGNLVLPLASGVLMIAVLFALNMSYGFFVESRAKRQITRRFGQYVPPELVDEMSEKPDDSPWKARAAR